MNFIKAQKEYVKTVADSTSLPTTGKSNVIYYQTDIDELKVWDGTDYVIINNSFYIFCDFKDIEDFEYVSPETFKIISIDNPNTITYTITVNSTPYVLGNTINIYDNVLITTLERGYLKIICQLL